MEKFEEWTGEPQKIRTVGDIKREGDANIVRKNREKLQKNFSKPFEKFPKANRKYSLAG